jgi:Spy/CpxP family protein refolding chaperone
MVTATGGSMKNKWVKIILVASLALNLAFVSAAIYKHFAFVHRERNKEIIQKSKPETIVETDFDLNADQKEKIKKALKTFELKLMEYKQNILDQRISIIEAMSDTDFNLQDIESKTQQLNKLENELNLLFVDALIQVNTLLEPRQRLNFLYKLSKNWFFIRARHIEREEIKEGGVHDRK